MYRSVEIRKKISGENLVDVLREAAKSIGLKAVTSDDYSTLNKLESGGGVKEDKSYDGTNVILFSKFLHLPLAYLYGIEKGEETDRFGMRTGISMPFPYTFGFASKRTIWKYLAAVSELIDNI